MTDVSPDLARALDKLPVIPKGAKLLGDDYTDFVSKVLDAHRAGASIRQISERTERGYGSIQRLIRAAAPESVRGRGGDNRRATRRRRSSTTTVARCANGDRPAEQPGQHLADGLRTSARRLPALSSAPARMGAFLTAVRAHRADSDLDVREGSVPLTGDGGNHFFSRP
ncbi:helix-turn-helix domain-containing protein [Streptomyces rubiginosohelvolus]|uniref:helix-turn-helix domain-containing protein n=1 Tax=Streptomyces rubiginosohelvolus TaxID=67362 RepID=UPI0033BF2D3A